MQCSSCGSPLPAGAMFCSNCGAKVNSEGNPDTRTVESSRVEPTIAASPLYEATPNTPASNQQAASASTAYGSPYGSLQQYSYDASPPPPPANSYATPPPSNSYGASYAPPPATYTPPGQPPSGRKGPRVGLIIGLVVLLLLIIVAGILGFNAARGGSTTNTSTPTATASASTPTTSAVTPTTQGTSPSGAAIDPAAAAIITKAQTAGAIDNNDLPTQLTSNFKLGQNVYVTFNLTTNNQSGFTEAKLYSGTTFAGSKILTIQSNFDHGFFTVTLNRAATGTVELYWCTQSNCSDAKLATFVTFQAA